MGVLAQELERLSTSKLGKNAGWMILGQGISVVLQAAYFSILARLLGAAAYGVFAGAFAFANLVAQYSTLGSGTIFLRYVAGSRPDFAKYWGNLILVTLVLGCILVALLTVFGRYILNPASASLVFFAAFAQCICFQLSIETARVFQTFEYMRVTAILNMLTNLVRTLCAGGLLLVLHKATAMQWTLTFTLVSFLSAAVAMACVAIRFGPAQFRPLMFPKHSAEGFGYVVSASATSIYNDLDKTILSHYGMNSALGVYTLAYRVIDIASLPIFSLRDAAMPKLFELGRVSGITASASFAGKLLKRTSLIGLAASVAVFLLAPLIPLIVGQSFHESVTALKWLAVIPLFRSFHQMSGSALTTGGYQHYRTGSQLGAALINCMLNIYLIPLYGWRGAAWASLATDGALCFVNSLLLRICSRQSKNMQQDLPSSAH